MTFECITAVFVQAESGDIHNTTLHSKSSSTSAFLSIVSEKTEEERSEEERDKFTSIELADFSKIAIFLSKVHTPQVYFVPYEHSSVQPSLFMLNCAFLI